MKHNANLCECLILTVLLLNLVLCFLLHVILCIVRLYVQLVYFALMELFCFRILRMASQSFSATRGTLKKTSIQPFRCLAHTQTCLCAAQVTENI